MKLSAYARKLGISYVSAWRLYGLRRSKRKTEKIIKALQDEKSTQ